MTPFESWSNGLEWAQESLIDQRERLMRQILGDFKYAKRIEFMDSIKPKDKQLKLFI